MLLYLNLVLIALAAGGPFEVLHLTLELLILGLELAKLFIKSLRQVLRHHGPFSSPWFKQTIVDALVRSSSIRATYSFQTIFVLGAELLRLWNSSLAEGTAPESYFRWGL